MELEKEPILEEARSEEEAKARQEKLEDYNAKFEEAMSESEREAQKTAAQIQQTRQSVLEMTPLRAQQETVLNPGETVYAIPQKESAKDGSMGWLKKAATVAGITLMSLLPSKEARAQQKMNADKDGIKKEVLSSRDFELSDSVKAEWDQYRNWYLAEVKKENLSNKELDRSAVAHRLMEKYNKETGSNIDDEMVNKVQNFFIQYRKFMEQAANKKKISVAADQQQWMPTISKPDGIAGMRMMSIPIPRGETTTYYQTKVNIPIKGKNFSVVVNNGNVKTYDGYVDTSKYEDNK
ncbi:MAG: hypothetical protein V4478_01350 [Patescibacteria group bacterium]